MKSGTIKVVASVITLTETLIIPDITKTELFYYTLFYGKYTKPLWEMQVDFICASKNTRTNTPSSRITRNHSSARTLKVAEHSFAACSC